MNSCRLLCVGVLACFIVISQNLTPAKAASISLRPVADTSILSASNYANNNFGGGLTFISGGRPANGLGASRALIRFDLSQIPADALITAASLRLNVVLSPNSRVNSIFDLDRLTASWVEGIGADRGGTHPANGATWNNRLGASGSPWATPGGDFLPAASGSISITGNGRYTVGSTPSLVADVQAWVDAPADNFGWLLRSESESTGRTIRRFASRNDQSNYPFLTIEYTVVPEPGTAPCLVLGITVLAFKKPIARVFRKL